MFFLEKFCLLHCATFILLMSKPYYYLLFRRSLHASSSAPVCVLAVLLIFCQCHRLIIRCLSYLNILIREIMMYICDYVPPPPSRGIPPDPKRQHQWLHKNSLLPHCPVVRLLEEYTLHILWRVQIKKSWKSQSWKSVLLIHLLCYICSTRYHSFLIKCNTAIYYCVL